MRCTYVCTYVCLHVSVGFMVPWVPRGKIRQKKETIDEGRGGVHGITRVGERRQKERRVEEWKEKMILAKGRWKGRKMCDLVRTRVASTRRRVSVFSWLSRHSTRTEYGVCRQYGYRVRGNNDFSRSRIETVRVQHPNLKKIIRRDSIEEESHCCTWNLASIDRKL